MAPQPVETLNTSPALQEAMELEARIDTHRPHLSDPAFERFKSLTLNYLDDFPTAPGQSPDTDGELAFSPTANFEHKAIANNEQETVAAVAATRGPLHDTLMERIGQEFDASRVAHDASLYEEALWKAADAEEEIIALLGDKQLAFSRLFADFSSNDQVIGEELSERMTEALAELSARILMSEIMPETPRNRVFGKRQAEQVYDHWLRSKASLLKEPLPTRDNILIDYFNSASAAYRRVLYGDREMNLTSGIYGDKTDEIDTFQRRHYEALGGYRIALTPTEWAQHMMAAFTDNLLYGEDSAISQALDEASGEYNRRARKNFSRAHAWQEHEPPREASAEEFDVRAGSEGLRGFLQDTYNSIGRLIVTELPGLKASETAKVMDICRNYLIAHETMLKPEDAGSHKLTQRIIKHIVTELHPDRTGSDEYIDICKSISKLFQDLKKQART